MAALDGGGHHVLLTGETGVGKTRLASAVSEALSRRGWSCHHFAGYPGGELVPFVPFAGLLSADQLHGELVDRFVRVADRLSGGDGAPSLVVVDDSHWLDEVSVAFLRYLCSRTVRLLLVARGGEQLPAPLAALVRDERLSHVELERLGRREVDQLVEAVLGGPPAPTLSSQLWELGGGNPLFLTELVTAAVDAGVLSARNGRWEQIRPMDEVMGGLESVIGLRYDRLEAAQREVVELVAVAGALGISALESMGHADTLARLEELGLVRADVSGRRVQVRLTHPLLDEVVRARLGAIGVRRRKHQLLDVVADSGRKRLSDRLLAAVWATELGAPQDPRTLVEVARETLNSFREAIDDLDSGGETLALPRQAHLQTAARLARRAVDSGGGLEAMELLHTILVLSGSHREAEEILEEMRAAVSNDEERFSVTRVEFGWAALNGDIEGAERANERAAALARGSAREPLVMAEQAQLLLGQGRLVRAVDLARTVLEDPAASPEARAQAMVALVAGMCPQGRPSSARNLLDKELAQLSGQESPLLMGMLMALRGVALTYEGALAEAEGVFQNGLMLAEAMGNAPAEGVFAVGGGQVLLNRGRASSALGRFAQAAEALSELDPFALRPMALAGWALSLCLLGRMEECRAVLGDLVSGHPLPETLNIGGRAWAWAEWHLGRRQEAFDILGRYIEDALGKGAAMDAATAAHDLLRLGGPGGDTVLSQVAPVLEGPLASAMVRHAEARRRRDAQALTAVSHDFEAIGADLLAADAGFHAAEAEMDSGRPARAERLLGRSRALVARCEGATTPLTRANLIQVDHLRRLTAREREVAALAAAGLSDRNISSQLCTSLRTVQNHLYRIYAKLGVNSRIELAGLLQVPPSGPE